MSDDSPLLREIGARLRSARRSAGLTQAEVAAMAGLSRPRYREIEAGLAAARLSSLANIARALGLEVVLLPQAMLGMVEGLMAEADSDRPAFAPDPPEDGEDG